MRHLAGWEIEGVTALDLSFSPIAASQLIAEGLYARVVFVTSRAAGRERGVIYERPMRYSSPTAEEVHAHIGDAVMGCVSLETLLVLCEFHHLLPEQTTIIDVEPEDQMWGPDLSPALQKLVQPAADLALRHAGSALRL
ncbi:MAG: hypothetical protein M3041_01900 [Acidobacteriota bacterium]|nr:hypothetical protein [Acidobacteriota bacterium]